MLRGARRGSSSAEDELLELPDPLVVLEPLEELLVVLEEAGWAAAGRASAQGTTRSQEGAMNGLLFKTRVAVLWVGVAVAMSGSLLLFLFAPGAVEEMLAGTMEGETLSDAWTFVLALIVIIPLVLAAVTLLVGDRVNHYLNLVAGPAVGLLGALPVMEILEGTFDGHVVMALAAAALGLLIGGLSVVGLRQAPSQRSRGHQEATV